MISPRVRSSARARSTRWLGTLVVLILIAAGCTSHTPKPTKTPTVAKTTPTSTVTSSLTVAPIRFADCTDQIAAGLPRADADRINRLTFSCGHVPVPMDYKQPFSTSIDLYVVRIHDTSQSKYQGSLLVNPGGPGASGVQAAITLGLDVSLDVLDNFDIIGFDPRGVFLSDPVQCISNATKDAIYDTDPDVRTAAGLARAVALYAPIGPACSKRYGDNLADFNTEYAARDMDLVRQGVSDKAMNFLGYGYGTRLGATYAHLFPSEVRTMVLDGGEDPTASTAVRAERQAAAFEASFTRFATSCAATPACARIGAARKAVTALVAKADHSALPTSKPGDKRKATGSTVVQAAEAALPDSAQWAALGAAIYAAQHGDARALFALVDAANQRSDDGTYSNALDVDIATRCNDDTAKLTDIQISTLARTWSVKYPLFGRSQAVSLLRCQSWPAARHAPPAATAPDSAPILVIGTTHDPLAPYAASGVLARTLGSGHLLTWAGAAHNAYPRTACVTSAVDKYLIEATMPSVATCPSG